MVDFRQREPQVQSPGAGEIPVTSRTRNMACENVGLAEGQTGRGERGSTLVARLFVTGGQTF